MVPVAPVVRSLGLVCTLQIILSHKLGVAFELFVQWSVFCPTREAGSDARAMHVRVHFVFIYFIILHVFFVVVYKVCSDGNYCNNTHWLEHIYLTVLIFSLLCFLKKYFFLLTYTNINVYYWM